MQSLNQLQDMLHSINRKSYPAYKSLKGAYQFKKYFLSIDHVQGDPFASPSHISVKLSHKEAGFPAEYYKDKLTRITLADYLTRQFEHLPIEAKVLLHKLERLMYLISLLFLLSKPDHLIGLLNFPYSNCYLIILRL